MIGVSTRGAAQAAAAAAAAQADERQALAAVQAELRGLTSDALLAEKSARALLCGWASTRVVKKRLAEAEATPRAVLHARALAFSPLVLLNPGAGEAEAASALEAWWQVAPQGAPRVELAALLMIDRLAALVGSVRGARAADLLEHEKKQLLKMLTTLGYTPSKRGRKRRAGDVDGAEGDDADDEGGGSEGDEAGPDEEEAAARSALEPAAPLFASPRENDAKGLSKGSSPRANSMIARLLAEVARA